MAEDAVGRPRLRRLRRVQEPYLDELLKCPADCTADNQDAKPTCRSFSTCIEFKKDELQCGACLLEIDHDSSSKEFVAVLDSCQPKHKFHPSCIMMWAKRENSCPQCKQRFQQVGVYDEHGCILHYTGVEERVQTCQPLDDHEFNFGAQASDACRICNSADDEASLLLCDGFGGTCNAAYHYYCIGLEGVPAGDWLCPACHAFDLNTCCGVCRGSHDEESLLLCDGNDGQCNAAYHFYCVGLNRVPDGDWFCPACASVRSEQSPVHTTEAPSVSLVSDDSCDSSWLGGSSGMDAEETHELEAGDLRFNRRSSRLQGRAPRLKRNSSCLRERASRIKTPKRKRNRPRRLRSSQGDADPGGRKRNYTSAMITKRRKPKAQPKRAASSVAKTSSTSTSSSTSSSSSSSSASSSPSSRVKSPGPRTYRPTAQSQSSTSSTQKIHVSTRCIAQASVTTAQALTEPTQLAQQSSGTSGSCGGGVPQTSAASSSRVAHQADADPGRTRLSASIVASEHAVTIPTQPEAAADSIASTVEPLATLSVSSAPGGFAGSTQTDSQRYIQGLVQDQIRGGPCSQCFHNRDPLVNQRVLEQISQLACARYSHLITYAQVVERQSEILQWVHERITTATRSPLLSAQNDAESGMATLRRSTAAARPAAIDRDLAQFVQGHLLRSRDLFSTMGVDERRVRRSCLQAKLSFQAQEKYASLAGACRTSWSGYLRTQAGRARITHWLNKKVSEVNALSRGGGS